MERIYNRTTEKLILKFNKEEYNSLTDKQKAEIKSAFLWSRGFSSWVSRAKSPNLWRARKVAESVGAFAEMTKEQRVLAAEMIAAFYNA